MKQGDLVVCNLQGDHPRYFDGVESIDRVSEDGTGFVINAYWYSEKELLAYVSSPVKAGMMQLAASVMGVGKDEPTVVNEKGGKQSRVHYDFTCLDPHAMFEMTRVLKEGADKYGKDNWRSIPVDDHLNHLIIHVFAYLAGDRSDDHLSHAMCRAMFATACAKEETVKEVGTDVANPQ